MAKKLYVGNLPYATTGADLESLFAKYGTVESATIIVFKDTGRSKGFGFVELSDDSDFQGAIKDLDGSDLGGRNIIVNEAKPMEDRPKREFRPRRDFGSRDNF